MKGRRVPPASRQSDYPTMDYQQALTLSRANPGVYTFEWWHHPNCLAVQTQRRADCRCTPELAFRRIRKAGTA